MAFLKFKQMLIEKGVPFEPNMLLEVGWQERLRNSGFTQTLNSTYIADGKLDGTVIADTLYLPEKVEIKGDTVILARRLVFEGKDVLIKGHSVDIAIFPIEPNVLTEPVAKKTNNYSGLSPDTLEFEQAFFTSHLAVVGGKFKVDVSGRPPINPPTKKGGPQVSLLNGPGMCYQGGNKNGCPGERGDDAPPLSNPIANQGEDSPDPRDGSCQGDPNGGDTADAGTGITGIIGKNAPNYGEEHGPTQGEDGGMIMMELPAGTTGEYTFTADKEAGAV
jgi:hypothetical protein